MVPSRFSRRLLLRAGGLGGAALALPACRPDELLVPETVGGVRAAFPRWTERHLEPDPSAGFLERVHPRGASEGRTWIQPAVQA